MCDHGARAGRRHQHHLLLPTPPPTDDRRAHRVQNLASASARAASAAHPRRTPERPTCCVVAHAPRASAHLAGCADTERFAHDAILLVLVQRRVSLARARTPRPADVVDAGRLRSVSCSLFETMSDRPPGPHVLRLLLRPDDLAELGVRRDQRRDAARAGTGRAARCERPRRPVVPRATLVSDDVVVHLAAAEHEPVRAGVVDERIVENRLERRQREIVERRRRLAESKKPLRAS